MRAPSARTYPQPQPLVEPAVRKLETLVEPDLESLFLLDSGAERDRCCERISCSNEAMYRVTWAPAQGVKPEEECRCRRTTLLCILCHTALIQPSGFPTCVVCSRYMQAVRVDKIRNTL